MDRFEVAQAVSTAKLLPVMEAWLSGKAVQYHVNNIYGEWTDFTGDTPAFQDLGFRWRVKPEPRHWWVNTYPDGEAEAFATKAEADSRAAGDRSGCVEVIEVLK